MCLRWRIFDDTDTANDSSATLLNSAPNKHSLWVHTAQFKKESDRPKANTDPRGIASNRSPDQAQDTTRGLLYSVQIYKKQKARRKSASNSGIHHVERRIAPSHSGGMGQGRPPRVRPGADPEGRAGGAVPRNQTPGEQQHRQ